MSTTQIRPTKDRILVQIDSPDEKTKGGIIIPDTAKEKPTRAKVIAIGPGKTTDEGKIIPIDLKVGDRILFGKWAGTEVEVNSNNDNEKKKMLIINETDVLAIIDQ